MRDGRGRPIYKSPWFWVPFAIVFFVTMVLLNPGLVFALLASSDILLGVSVVAAIGIYAYGRHLDREIERNEEELERLRAEIEDWKRYRNFRSERDYWRNTAEEEQ